MRRSFIAGLLAIFYLLTSLSSALALPPSFLDESIADNWNQAVGVTFASDGRMFVWEKGGRVWNVENGVKAASPLIDISDEVGDWRDYGFLGFAVDPDFYNNGYIYLLYVVDYYHLLFGGQPGYDPGADWYFQDTIARLTRYTCNAGDGYRSVDYGSRTVLIGDSISTGFPMCHQSHGIGSLVFGEDGTLLMTCGDGASYETVDTGGPTSGSSNTCLADGIIRPAEDVGAFRSQLLNAMNGKVLRIDPATGEGLPSNPFYDPLNPSSPQSRVWALGLRNPFRATLRPGSGVSDPSIGDPGSLYIGDVGWNSWEELNIVREPGVNFGWPIYEGYEENWGYYFAPTQNQDAPNPLFGTTPPGQGLCSQQSFDFQDLLIQDTLDPSPVWPNQCDPNSNISPVTTTFEHQRPALDWSHGGTSRVGTYVGNNAAVANIGDVGSPVDGPQFGGNSSTAGVWYTGTDFPPEYQYTYFQAEFGARWLRNIVFDSNDNPVLVRDFGDNNTGSIVAVSTDPVNGGLYYIAYDQSGCCMLRRITWVDNLPPIAMVQASVHYGPAPLTVNFTGNTSFDPDGSMGQELTYEWDFGDGTTSNVPNPIHTFPSADITDDGSFIARVFELSPPHPLGGGNWDPEVMRDDDYPPEGNFDSYRQYDTFHFGDQGNLEWVGYAFSSPRVIKGLTFQEGIHFWDGGWFDSHQIQVRISGVWTAVTGLVTTPAYAGNNGINYETYQFDFNPVTADAVRIHGQPGGVADFISVGELRVTGEPTPPVGPHVYNVTLTVRDYLQGEDVENFLISVNNTPPMVNITSPPIGAMYVPEGNTTMPLTADISDTEHSAGELTCQWQTIMHHDEHTHPEPFDEACETEAVLSPHGGADCDGQSTFYYEVVLKVTDAHGLSTTVSRDVNPDCDEGCLNNIDCRDMTSCTHDRCTASACSNAGVIFGDVNGTFTLVVDLDDILCTLSGFTSYNNCMNADIAGCGPNNTIDLDDILAVLGAFAGNDPCNCDGP